MQSFAQGTGDGILGFGDMANQAITNPQKAASDLYQALSTTVDTYLKQKEAIYNQCSGDFSQVTALLKNAPDSVKKYYDTVAQHYRCEYTNIRPGEREIEAWVVGDILKDQQRAEWWESVKQMSSEEIAYHAGKLTAETILTDGAMRVVGSALQVARLEGGALYQIAKKGTGDLAATTVAKTAQAAQKITLTADQLGTKMAQKVAGESTEVTAAGTEGVFKTTIKKPGVAEACESIAKNPPKMQIVKDAGQAAKGSVINQVTFKDGLNFTNKTIMHMDNPNRFVPTQILKESITSGKRLADPRGTDAFMYYTTMSKNGKVYNLEVLYNKETNTILHFKYTPEAIGPLPKIK